ncbi:MAG: InlB B-repeat-containing protein, partial [Bacteroidales bacterium]|nr:InlB B-repeat-containing protein [Bacteroidales bacterium]
PVRNGYTFGGWYRQAACTDQWDFENDTIYNNTTLYAQWTANIYNITYHLNGGTNHSDNPATFTVEDTVILQSPSKTGCEFAGWYNNSFLTGTAVFGIFAETGDREYWAGWPVVAHVELNDSLGNPVDAQGARVLFYPADGAATTDVYEADRESAGHYRVILPEGQYIAVAENVPGHLTTYYAEAESATQWDDATKLTAAEANGDLNIVFRMKPIPAIKEGKVVIDGYVVYEDGEQKAKVARNATVGIYRSKKGSAQKTFKPDDGEWQLVRTVQPDENGYFVVRNLPAGKYLVVADIPGYELTDGYEIDAENADDTIEGVITFSGNNFVVNDSAQTIAVDVPTSAPDMSESETFRLSPNPFTGELRLTGAEGGTLRVFSSGGALVHIRKTTGADETLHLERLPAGLYFFRLEKDGKVKTLKAVKSE